MQVADGVINLKAEYGIDADADGTVAPAEWTASAPADWRRLLAGPRRRAGAQPTVRAQRRPGGERRARGHADRAQPVLLRRSGRTARSVMTNLDSDADTFNDVTRRSQQLALLPLSRLRARHPAAQHALGDDRMKSSRQQERRASLFVALIVLIIMTLAGLALLRQMGVGTSIAGNVAFKENATSVADRGTEFANAGWSPTTRSRASDSIANGYISNWGTSVDPNTYDWDNQARLLVDDEARNRQPDTLHHPSAVRVQGLERDRCQSDLLGLPGPQQRRFARRRPATRASCRARPPSRSSASRPASTGHETRSASPKFWFSNRDRWPKYREPS